MSAIIKKLSKWDIKTSSKIHNMKKSWSMDYAMSVPGMMFNPFYFPIIFSLMVFLFPICEQEMKGITDISALEPN